MARVHFCRRQRELCHILKHQKGHYEPQSCARSRPRAHAVMWRECAAATAKIEPHTRRARHCLYLARFIRLKQVISIATATPSTLLQLCAGGRTGAQARVSLALFVTAVRARVGYDTKDALRA